MPKDDAVLLSAEEIAREAVLSVGRPDSIGAHMAATMEADRLAVHRFACLDRGYVGWQWEVSLTRAPRSKVVTVCEVGLVPGEGALLAPPWIPWEERLLPGDASREDVLPYNANDSRLIAGFEQTDEETMDQLDIDEIGFGRPRVLSTEGIDAAAKRWYSSDRGPVSGAKAKAQCGSCGFLLKMSGSLGQVFGICANEWAQDDGSVVALEHSCGAHSETDVKRRRPQWSAAPSRIDDFDVEVMDLN